MPLCCLDAEHQLTTTHVHTTVTPYSIRAQYPGPYSVLACSPRGKYMRYNIHVHDAALEPMKSYAPRGTILDHLSASGRSKAVRTCRWHDLRTDTLVFGIKIDPSSCWLAQASVHDLAQCAGPREILASYKVGRTAPDAKYEVPSG